MKKQIVIAALSLVAIALGNNQVLAQNSDQASTSVNIMLADVISMDVGSVASGGTVDFNYVNTADYNSSKNVTVPNSLVIISSKNFDVKVKSEGANFVSGTNVIPVDVLQVKAIPGGSLTGTLNEITLSTTDQLLVSNANLGSKQSLNIAYSISAENYFKKGGLQTNINSNILQIGVDGSSVNVPLSKTPQKILFNGTPVLDRELNVKYTIQPSSAQSLVGKENTTYSINVYYSFTAI